jgi:hypothetical protein
MDPLGNLPLGPTLGEEKFDEMSSNTAAGRD